MANSPRGKRNKGTIMVLLVVASLLLISGAIVLLPEGGRPHLTLEIGSYVVWTSYDVSGENKTEVGLARMAVVGIENGSYELEYRHDSADSGPGYQVRMTNLTEQRAIDFLRWVPSDIYVSADHQQVILAQTAFGLRACEILSLEDGSQSITMTMGRYNGVVYSVETRDLDTSTSG